MASSPKVFTITSIKDAIPKEKVWYSYYDDIFISVICGYNRKSHIRRKNQNLINRKDSVMSDWHCDWQYNQIEATYGKSIGNEKTYEIAISFNGERHIIDSVVKDIAIEFQHSLGVRTKELDLRFIAHNALGFTPYLVLNFTLHAIPEICKHPGDYSHEIILKLVKRIDQNENDREVWRKLRKWTLSKHFDAGNLFLEFQDGLVRLHKDLTNGCVIIEKEFFLRCLTLLDQQLEKKIESDFCEREQHKMQIERIREEEKNKRLQEVAVKEEINRQAKKNALQQNNFAKENDHKYRHFKFIVENQIVGKYLEVFDFAKLYIDAEVLTTKTEDATGRLYVYSCEEERLIMTFNTRKVKDLLNNGYKYISEINIARRIDYEIKTFTFIQDTEMPWRILEKKVELVKGYLHSLSNAALINYDRSGRKIGKYYYIHNHIVEEDIFNEISMLFSLGGMPLDYLKSNMSDNQFKRLIHFKKQIEEKEDKYHFLSGIISNSGIREEEIIRYYIDNTMYFDSELLKQFYVCDY